MSTTAIMYPRVPYPPAIADTPAREQPQSAKGLWTTYTWDAEGVAVSWRGRERQRIPWRKLVSTRTVVVEQNRFLELYSDAARIRIPLAQVNSHLKDLQARIHRHLDENAAALAGQAEIRFHYPPLLTKEQWQRTAIACTALPALGLLQVLVDDHGNPFWIVWRFVELLGRLSEPLVQVAVLLLVSVVGVWILLFGVIAALQIRFLRDLLLLSPLRLTPRELVFAPGHNGQQRRDRRHGGCAVARGACRLPCRDRAECRTRQRLCACAGAA